MALMCEQPRKPKSQAFVRKLIRVGELISLHDIKNAMRQIDNLRDKDTQKNLVTVIKYSRLPQASAFYFIDMELCSYNLETFILDRKDVPLSVSSRNIESDKLLKRITSNLKILKQITAGLQFIHNQNEIHRNLKPTNGILYLFQN
jgi:serine/threonine protein kinase